MVKTVKLSVEKETKGTYRFREEGAEDKHVFGTLYVRKSALGGEKPKTLTIQVEIL